MAELETSVSTLLNALAEEIRIITKSEFSIEQITVFNDYISENLKSVTKLHLILLMKYDLLINAIPVQYSQERIDPKIQNHDISEDKFCYMRSEVKIKFPSLNIPVAYILKGRGQGNVVNRDDSFTSGLAIFQTCIFSTPCEKEEPFFYYSVMKDTKMLVLIASHKNIETKFNIKSDYKIISARGTGKVIMKERSKADRMIIGSFAFNLRIQNITDEYAFFDMIILTDANKCFNHESGQIKSPVSRLTIEQVDKYI